LKGSFNEKKEAVFKRVKTLLTVSGSDLKKEELQEKFDTRASDPVHVNNVNFF
jgi:hypothetical protein